MRLERAYTWNAMERIERINRTVQPVGFEEMERMERLFALARTCARAYPRGGVRARTYARYPFHAFHPFHVLIIRSIEKKVSPFYAFHSVPCVHAAAAFYAAADAPESVVSAAAESKTGA